MQLHSCQFRLFSIAFIQWVPALRSDVVLRSIPRNKLFSKFFDIDGFNWGDKAYFDKLNKTNVYDSPINIYEVNIGSWKKNGENYLSYSELAKELRYASPKPQQTENEKYAFRCWMLRLGFIGKEFATAREILLRNMEGNAAWR